MFRDRPWHSSFTISSDSSDQLSLTSVEHGLYEIFNVASFVTGRLAENGAVVFRVTHFRARLRTVVCSSSWTCRD